MARHTMTTVIDGQKYEIGQFPGHKAMPLFVKVSRKIAPMVGGLRALSGDDGKTLTREQILESDLGELVEVLLPCLIEVLESLDDGQMMPILEQILSMVRYQGPEMDAEELGAPGAVNVDLHYTGYPLHMIKVVIATLRHNYTDFLGAIPFQSMGLVGLK